MLFDARVLSVDDFYDVLLQTIVPRPIAWVLSRNANGSLNLAPFSFFNGVSAEPPILMISVGWKEEGVRKDTWTNIAERDAFVVHIAPTSMAPALVATAARLPAGVSEVEAGRLGTKPIDNEDLPRLEGPRAALFCRRHRILEVGDQALILGQVHRIWVDDAALRAAPDGPVIDASVLDPLARLGGRRYAGLGPVMDLDRPR